MTGGPSLASSIPGPPQEPWSHACGFQEHRPCRPSPRGCDSDKDTEPNRPSPLTRQGSQSGVQTSSPRAGDAGLLFPGARGAQALQDRLRFPVLCSLLSPSLELPASLPLPEVWLSPERGAHLVGGPPSWTWVLAPPSGASAAVLRAPAGRGVPVTQGHSRGDTRHLCSRQ